jgi:hypothetical protein
MLSATGRGTKRDRPAASAVVAIGARPSSHNPAAIARIRQSVVRA